MEIAVLGAALPATLTFAFQRLEHLLSSRRAKPEQDLAVPDVLTGTLQLPLTADEDRLQARGAELQMLHDILVRYADGNTAIRAEDKTLMRNLGMLRAALEDIYGQRLTFAGEDRPASGPFVTQKLGTLTGEATGMDADYIVGTAQVDQEAERVEAGAKLIGMKARRIGE
ncbi:hypothetical protein [Streptomyces wedmorensis]|uniref:hypothetical protein n=1 Tax=Streptomyces wedmorensis TaxID=43759 RepID=UPI0037A97DDD